MKEMVGGCCVCSDERGWPDNPLVYCDGNGCTVAVHQACYGIVSVPTGPWYCRKCESPETKGKVRCELCPSKSGALKRSDTGGWAHVVCALYIPEVRFGNVTSMEPIVLRLIPPERYNKTCYICQDVGKSNRASAGACMQCNKSGCKQQFHVTCAQSLGLLCEEAGNYLDNVKYCGYCQHHYSKLKKGGNVKTIPPYKPVSHDSPSSDSSGEKEGDASPKPAGAATPTHSSKNKGPGRKSSHSGSSGGKTPSSKTPTSTSTSMDTSLESPDVPASRRHKADKNKSRKSPSRRGSSAGDSGSKSSTPAPSPQHSSEVSQSHAGKAGGSTPSSSSKATPPRASPGSIKSQESSVISSVASAAAAIQASPSAAPTPASIAAVSTSVVQPPSQAKPTTYPESVITNTDCIEMKQTKKRKAISAAAAAAELAAAAAAALPPPPPPVTDQKITDLTIPTKSIEVQQPPSNMWEKNALGCTDVVMECIDKKKAKTDPEPAVITHYAPPPPPPAHSPAMQPSPRHLTNSMPGPSGLPAASNIRSPASQPQGKEREREGPVSLLVSVPLPPAPHGLSRGALAQAVGGASSEGRGPSPHIFHQLQKHAAMESSVPSHSPHGVPGRSTWGGLNVSYEMQPPEKTSVPSSAPGTSKDSVMGTTNIRTKKRAAMAASVASMSSSNPSLPPPGVQNLAGVRRPPQPTPPPIYQETIKDSPPSSPGSERPLKPKVESKMNASTAPHMLGNELNPESGAAARLQEQLSAELAAHAAGSAAAAALVPPPLLNKATQGGARASSGGSGAQSLDQLLERQWEQGSQFLMEQAQHFDSTWDIASLLSCLHQLRTENVRLEDHVGNLLQRRDHLLAVNARLAIPLNTAGGPPEPARPSRENGGGQMRAPPGPPRPENLTPDRPHQLMVRDTPKPS